MKLSNAKRKIMKSIALMIFDILVRLCHLFGRGGTSFSGYIAKIICPDIISDIIEGKKVILVTGTNGKTTTVRMIAHMLESASLICVYTKYGENIESSILTTILKSYDRHLKKIIAQYVIVECDEKFLAKMIQILKPVCITITNISSGQVDRLGTPKNVANFFSLAFENYNGYLCADLNDQYIKEAIQHHNINKIISYSYLKDEVAVQDKVYKPKLNVLGKYNVANAAAAIASIKAIGTFDESMINSFSSFSLSFGRMEEFYVENTKVIINLTKNTMGVIETLKLIEEENIDACVVFGFNDNVEDGTDLSWLKEIPWSAYKKHLTNTLIYVDNNDKQCEFLPNFNNKQNRIYDINALINMIKKSEKLVFMFLNYTCLMNVRKELAKRHYICQFWEYE